MFFTLAVVVLLISINTLNDAMIQYLRLPGINCFCLLPGQEDLPHQVVEGEKDEVWYSQDLCQHLLLSVEWKSIQYDDSTLFVKEKHMTEYLDIQITLELFSQGKNQV